MLASSGQTENGSFASRVMAEDTSEISRSISGGENLKTGVSVKSSGPILVSDYASRKRTSLPDTLACAFITQMQKQEQESDYTQWGY